MHIVELASEVARRAAGDSGNRAEALQILENDLLRLARERHAPQLQTATPEKRKELMAQIEREVQEELRRRRLKRGYPGALWF